MLHRGIRTLKCRFSSKRPHRHSHIIAWCPAPWPAADHSDYPVILFPPFLPPGCWDFWKESRSLSRWFFVHSYSQPQLKLWKHYCSPSHLPLHSLNSNWSNRPAPTHSLHSRFILSPCAPHLTPPHQRPFRGVWGPRWGAALVSPSRPRSFLRLDQEGAGSLPSFPGWPPQLAWLFRPSSPLPSLSLSHFPFYWLFVSFSLLRVSIA